MKILAIGNSFSEDATYYLHKMANSAGLQAEVVNLYIGGCSLEGHADNIRHHRPAYRVERNGVHTDQTASIEQILRETAWDIVTVQQVSGYAGIYDSYGPHLDTVLSCIRQHAPHATVWFHQTWAYEIDSAHPDFARYDRHQPTMYGAVAETVNRVCAERGLPVIPCGDVVQAVRRHPVFDYAHGGRSLCRDGFHMDVVYGRYLLGLVWFATLLHGDLNAVTFCPTEQDLVNGYTYPDFSCDTAILALLKEISRETLSRRNESRLTAPTANGYGPTSVV